MFETPFETRDGSLNVGSSITSGRPPLVMLHGVTRRWQTFMPLAASLSLRYSLQAIDFRGHGKTPPVVGRYRVVDYAVDAIAFVESQGQPVVVYGHSLGAMVAAIVAAERPSRVAAVIMEDPPFHTMGSRIGSTPLLSFFTALQSFANDPRGVGVVARELAEVRLHDPQTKAEVRLGDGRDMASLRFTAACLKQLDPEVFDPIVAGQWLDGFEIETLMPRLQCPVLLIQADIEQGGMLCDADADLVEQKANDVTRVRLPGCGHLAHWSRTTELLNYVHAFLESLER